MKKVLVAMRAHEEAPWIIEALNSIVSQEYDGKIKISLSLDRPSDNLLTRLQEWPHYERLHLFLADNLGLSSPLNSMIGNSNCDYVCILDSDDLMLPGRIARQVEFLELNPDVAVVGSHINLIDSSGKFVGVKSYPISKDLIRKNRLKRIPVAHPAVMMRVDAVKKVGGYRKFYDFAEDFDLWVRILEKYEISNIDAVLSAYRLHDLQSTKKFNKKNVLAATAVIGATKAKKQGKIEPHLKYESVDDYSRTLKIYLKVMYRNIVYETINRIRKEFLKKKFFSFIFFGLCLFFLSPSFVIKKSVQSFRKYSEF